MLLTKEQAAERADVSKLAFRKAVALGLGPKGVEAGKRLLYEPAEVDRWVKANGLDKRRRADPVLALLGVARKERTKKKATA